MIYDPHTEFNWNFKPEWWSYYQSDERTNQIASKVREVIDSGMVAVVKNKTLCELHFDMMCRLGSMAISIQVFGWSPHHSACAIAMLIHACYVRDSDDKNNGVTRFMKSLSSNPIMYYPNITFVEDNFGRQFPVFKIRAKEIKAEQLSMFEF
jgi:hypothetical protein